MEYCVYPIRGCNLLGYLILLLNSNAAAYLLLKFGDDEPMIRTER